MSCDSIQLKNMGLNMVSILLYIWCRMVEKGKERWLRELHNFELWR